MHRIDYPETHTTEGYCSQISMEESADHRTVKYRLDLFQTEQDRASKRIKQVESLARSASADEIDGFLQEYAQSMEEVDQSLHQLLLRRTDFMSKWSVYDFARRILNVRLPAETTLRKKIRPSASTFPTSSSRLTCGWKKSFPGASSKSAGSSAML